MKTFRQCRAVFDLSVLKVRFILALFVTKDRVSLVLSGVICICLRVANESCHALCFELCLEFSKGYDSRDPCLINYKINSWRWRVHTSGILFKLSAMNVVLIYFIFFVCHYTRILQTQIYNYKIVNEDKINNIADFCLIISKKFQDCII